MTRTALPQNYILTPATVLESMSSLTGWTVSGSSCTLALGANGGIDCTSLVAGGFTQFYKNGSFDLSKTNYIEFDLNIPDISKLNSVSLYLFTDAGYSKFFLKSISAAELAQGNNRVRIYKNDFAPNSSPDFNLNITRIRFAWYPIAGQNTTINFKNITISQKSLPKTVFTFDDGYKSVIDIAYPYMQARGIKGTVFIISSLVGSAGYLTLSDLQTLHNSGWIIANHTKSHQQLASLAITEQRIEIKDCQDYLITNGFNDGASYMAFPFGSYNQDTLDLCAELGITVARAASAGINIAPITNLLLLKCVPYDTTISVANLKALYVDKAVYQGGVLVPMLHSIEATTTQSYNMSTTNFQAMIDYHIQRKTDNLTISEFYNGLTNPRKSVSRS